MSQSPFDGVATPNPHPLEGSNALGIPPPLPPTPPLDTRSDGIDPDPIDPRPGSVATIPEFKPDARVLFVNGINSNEVESRNEAQSYADAIGHRVELVHVATRGMLTDIGTAKS